AWTGRPTGLDADGGRLLLPPADLPACAAPILRWLSEWSGFRGPSRTALPQAAACDVVFAAGASDIDLLPQLLFEEQGAFRFGLSPWHSTRKGPWSCPQDAFVSDAPWSGWTSHVREVVARARATPGLSRWRLGLVQSANTPAEEKRLRTLIDGCSRLVAACDDRPVVSCHPQSVDYMYGDEQSQGRPCWFGFEQSLDGWQSGPQPLVPEDTARLNPFASEGTSSLRFELSQRGAQGGVAMGGAMCAIDGNLFSVETLACDLAADGGGMVQFYAWATDERHRWFQQRLACIPANHRWNTVTIAFGDDAAWEALVPGSSWGAEARRRIRRIGVMAFRHADASSTPAAVCYLDRVRRLGWPREAERRLTFERIAKSPAEVSRYQPLSADFDLSLAAKNPFDPDSADVVAEVEGPIGATGSKRIRYPAYWAEPIRLDWAGGREQTVTDGVGRWHWRFSPPAEGRWRWRLVARIKHRETWRQAESDWCETVVRGGAAADALVPVRVSRTDAQTWEREDGTWFYPLGINLRSPGDSRQDQVLSEVPGAAGGAIDDIQRPLRRSEDFERLGTRAYERWFARLHAAGGNWARVWMCPWWCGLEWKRSWDGFGGIGWYSQESAARLDRVLDLAAANSIYVQIELQNHGMFSEKVDPEWVDNPYNARNGGPCRTPAEFFSSDAMWTIHAKRLRYTLARWGWRSHVAAWVLSSEMEFTAPWYSESAAAGDHSPTLQSWVDRSLAWFRDHDPQQRAVSIHFSHPWEGTKIWKTTGLGFSNSNAYTGFQAFPQLGGMRDGLFDLPRALDWYLNQHFPPSKLKRPTLVGEWGGHWSENHSPRLSAELHTGLWLQAVLPYAGNTGFWWYLWVDASDSWGEFAPIAAFVAGDDRRGAGFVTANPRCDRQPIVSAIGMASATAHRYYAWTTGLDQDPTRSHPGDAGAMRVATGQALSRWQIERWRCRDGTVSQRTEAQADAQGQLAVPLGALEPDAAFKLQRLEPAAATPKP
ncbi:MAG: DUF5060 domain-containing protein, partial [Planctomycetes bacterium]|nr:DUF5060 domain-containing protein [Planctomycetota bacterium]